MSERERPDRPAAPTDRHGDLEIGQDPRFQRREWTIQRIGWVVMLLILLAGMIGLFGRGPLAEATTGSADRRLHVEYQRFDRKGAPTRLAVTIEPREPGGEIALWLSRDYLDQVEIISIHPEPTEQRADDERIVFVIEPAAESGPVVVAVVIEHLQFGARRAVLGLENGPTVAFTQYVYP